MDKKKEVYIYRLLSTGTIEEKKFQRQISKQAMSRSLIGSDLTQQHFSTEELRDLFTLNEDTDCDTLDIVSGKTIKVQYISKDEIASWDHRKIDKVEDPILNNLSNQITYVFQKKTTPKFENEDLEEPKSE